MSYEKQTWKTGDIITADKLNHIENGIGSSGGWGGWLIVDLSTEFVEGRPTMTLNKTWREIKDAFPFVKIISNVDNNGGTLYILGDLFSEENIYRVDVLVSYSPDPNKNLRYLNNVKFKSDTEDGILSGILEN